MRNFINIVENSLAGGSGKKRRGTDVEFINAAREIFPTTAHKLSLPDLMRVSDESGMQIPSSIRHNRELKVDAHHWNLAGSSAPDVDTKIAKDLGVSVEGGADAAGEEYSDAIRLAKAQQMTRLAAKGKLYVMGRKPNGAFFRIPGIEEYTAQLERMLSRELAEKGDQSMEEQYKLMTEKVELIAGGTSQFIKSLLITGGPSTGKTYTVMQSVKKLGMVEGKDYIVKKGRITVLSMYRTLIEQLNGLTIFDDCDSVVEDKNGINMLKGALDTDPIREISYDVRGTVNIAALSSDERTEYVEALSRAMRYVETPEDVAYFRNFLSKIGLLSKILKNKKKSQPSRDEDEDSIEDDFEDEGDTEESDLILSYVRTHLPNKIDFKGRIIFISNLDESEWDSAILTRAFSQNMNFDSAEMLDFIDRIKGSIVTPHLTDEEKQEVMDYIRQLYQTGKLRRPVNFRLVQQAFDLRKTESWKKILNSL